MHNHISEYTCLRKEDKYDRGATAVDLWSLKTTYSTCSANITSSVLLFYSLWPVNVHSFAVKTN